jgi:hypothetical protein
MLLQGKQGIRPILEMNAPAHLSHAIHSLTNRSVREHVDAVAFTYWESFKLLRVYPTIFLSVKGNLLTGYPLIFCKNDHAPRHPLP